MPKLIRSASESYCTPNSLWVLVSRDAPIEAVEDRGDEDRHAGGLEPALRSGDDRAKAAEQAAGGEQIGQQVDPAAARALPGLLFHGRECIRPVAPPAGRRAVTIRCSAASSGFPLLLHSLRSSLPASSPPPPPLPPPP